MGSYKTIQKIGLFLNLQKRIAMCIWNVKESERHCDFCVVEMCPDRQPKQPKIVTTTQTDFELQPIFQDYKTE